MENHDIDNATALKILKEEEEACFGSWLTYISLLDQTI